MPFTPSAPLRALAVALAGVGAALAGCEDQPATTPDAGPTTTLDDYLPPLPEPDGTARGAWAGAITPETQGELIPGPVSAGVVGDVYLRNERVRFVVQGPTRVVGPNPFGGNVIDAALVDGGAGGSPGEDQLGEVSFMYVAGRTCAHERVDVLRDGSGGGPAVVRARGRAGVNEWVNLRAMGVIAIRPEILSEVEDGVECATTYTLRPGSSALEIAWTLYNGGARRVHGPFAALTDPGGEVETFAPLLGFHKLSVDDLASLSEPVAAPYDVLQGPGIAYGLVARPESPDTPVAALHVVAVSILLFGGAELADLLAERGWYLDLAPDAGTTIDLDLVVGRDAAEIDAYYHAESGRAPVAVGGRVAFGPSGSPGAGAHVGVYRDLDADAEVGDEDAILTFFEVAADGAFGGRLPPGDYLLRADLADVARSETRAITVGASAIDVGELTLADPAVFAYAILDDATGERMPGKLTVVGRTPVPLDRRLQPPWESVFGVVGVVHSVYGGTEGADPVDATLRIPAGGPYRIFASRGPEWSVASEVVTPAAGAHDALTFRLRRVLDTTGYVATEFHQHAIGSPDSSLPNERRLASLVAEGIEFFASTDHDYLTDYDPLIDALGLRGLIDGVVGVEASPFAWGHFNAWPLTIDLEHPAHGALDWAAGAAPGLCKTPEELFAALRDDLGARVVEANHPRATGSNFMTYFDAMGLVFDFDARTYGTELMQMRVPPEWLRLPPGDLFSDAFDVIEVWNGFDYEDSDADGVRENALLDAVMRDWFNFLSLGVVFTPLGNSDTHVATREPPGVARSLIRVADDGAEALRAGLDEEVYATILGSAGRPRDVVVTDGPMLRVLAGADGPSAIGAQVAAVGGEASFTLVAESPEWIELDTLEVFVNTALDPPDDVTALPPAACFTTRDPSEMAATDPCKLAPLGGARPMAVEVVAAGGVGRRREARVSFTLTAADVAAVNRAGARGGDAWMVVRVRGQRPIFPVYAWGALDEASLDAVLLAETEGALVEALGRRGVTPAALTAPIWIDFDGGGFRAPFAP